MDSECSSGVSTGADEAHGGNVYQSDEHDEGISVQPVSFGKAGAVHKAGLLAGPRPHVSCGAGRILEEEAVCATGQVFSGYPQMD